MTAVCELERCAFTYCHDVSPHSDSTCCARSQSAQDMRSCSCYQPSQHDRMLVIFLLFVAIVTVAMTANQMLYSAACARTTNSQHGKIGDLGMWVGIIGIINNISFDPALPFILISSWKAEMFPHFFFLNAIDGTKIGGKYLDWLAVWNVTFDPDVSVSIRKKKSNPNFPHYFYFCKCKMAIFWMCWQPRLCETLLHFFFF